MRPLAIQQIYKIPPSLLWRVLVYNPDFSQDLYCQFQDEPGALQGMTNGLNFVLTSYQQPVSIDYIIRLHDIATDGVTTLFTYAGDDSTIEQQSFSFEKGLRRNYAVTFGLLANQNLTRAGTFDLLTRLAGGNRYFTIEKASPPEPINITKGTTITQRLAEKYFDIFTATPHNISTNKDPAIVLAAMDFSIQNFTILIQQQHTPEEKIFYIANFLHTLELIHPFSDGNCRTFGVLLLIKLLIQYNLPLSILRDPNVLDGFGPAEIRDHIIQGQKLIEQLIAGRAENVSPKQPIYLTKQKLFSSAMRCTLL